MAVQLNYVYHQTKQQMPLNLRKKKTFLERKKTPAFEPYSLVAIPFNYLKYLIIIYAFDQFKFQILFEIYMISLSIFECTYN